MLEKKKVLVCSIFSFSGVVSISFASLTLSHTRPGFYVSAVQVFENTLGKGEIAHSEQFLLFPQYFPPTWKTLPFSSNLKLSSANSFCLEGFKISHLGEGKNLGLHGKEKADEGICV